MESRHAVRQPHEGAKYADIEAHGWRHWPPSREAGVATGLPPTFSPYGENRTESEKEDVMDRYDIYTKDDARILYERDNEYGDWVKYEDAAARIRDLEAQLAKIAHIAHNDGLDNLTEAEALKRICILSLAWRDRRV